MRKRLSTLATFRPGVYDFTYMIRPSMAGEYKVIPPNAKQLYFPEVYGARRWHAV